MKACEDIIFSPVSRKPIFEFLSLCRQGNWDSFYEGEDEMKEKLAWRYLHANISCGGTKPPDSTWNRSIWGAYSLVGKTCLDSM